MFSATDETIRRCTGRKKENHMSNRPRTFNTGQWKRAHRLVPGFLFLSSHVNILREPTPSWSTIAYLTWWSRALAFWSSNTSRVKKSSLLEWYRVSSLSGENMVHCFASVLCFEAHNPSAIHWAVLEASEHRFFYSMDIYIFNGAYFYLSSTCQYA